MAWVKIPREHHSVFEAALPDDDRLEVKAMFGGLAAMLDGRMVGGLFGTTAIVKLAPPDYAALVAKGGIPFDPMGNRRVMAETLLLPQGEFDDRVALAQWLAKARDHVASLPPKAGRPSTKPAKKRSAKKRSAPPR